MKTMTSRRILFPVSHPPPVIGRWLMGRRLAAICDGVLQRGEGQGIVVSRAPTDSLPLPHISRLPELRKPGLQNPANFLPAAKTKPKEPEHPQIASSAE